MATSPDMLSVLQASARNGYALKMICKYYIINCVVFLTVLCCLPVNLK